MTDNNYPEHSQATTVLVLGILGLVLCPCLGPFAWYFGGKELKGIAEGNRPPENQGTAQAGKVLGIIATVLLAVGIVFALGLIVLFTLMAVTS